MKRPGSGFTVDQVRNIYSHTAAYYDRAVRLFALLGAHVGRYRREAVAALHLKSGDTAVELGCGTGLNLALLRSAVGSEGRAVGVDLTPEMLDRARQKVKRHGWSNVELVRCDVAEYQFPERLNGVLSVLAITLSPDFDQVIQRAASALAPEGRIAIFDLKRPTGWPEWLVRLTAWLNRPFGNRNHSSCKQVDGVGAAPRPDIDFLQIVATPSRSLYDDEVPAFVAGAFGASRDRVPFGSKVTL